MKQTATLIPVTESAQRDLFGFELATRPSGGLIAPIMSKKDETKQLGRRVTFDAATLADFKSKLAADKSLNAATKKSMRQQFLNADAIKQRQMLGIAAVQAAFAPDEFAPSGRVPDVMELRANGRLTLVSVEKFIGKNATETPKQKIERLERELREAKAAKADADAPEAETAPTVEALPETAAE